MGCWGVVVGRVTVFDWLVAARFLCLPLSFEGGLQAELGRKRESMLGGRAMMVLSSAWIFLRRLVTT